MLDLIRAKKDLFIIIALSALMQTWIMTGWVWFSYPDIVVSMLRVYFHELGHGFASLLAGGYFYRIELAFGQGGLAHTDLNNIHRDAIMLFAGYLAPSLWGLLIYAAFTRWLRNNFDWVVWLCVALGTITIGFWVRDFTTFSIVVMIIGVFYLVTQLKYDREMYWAIKFFSVYLIMAGGIDPYITYYYPEYFAPAMVAAWDGKILSQLTSHNELFWVYCWMVASVLCFIVLVFMEFYFEVDDYGEWDGQLDD